MSNPLVLPDPNVEKAADDMGLSKLKDELVGERPYGGDREQVQAQEPEARGDHEERHNIRAS